MLWSSFFFLFFVILHSTPIWAATKTTLCYVKNYCCTWRKIVIIVTASCSFSCSICLRVGLHHRLFLWVFVYICASGAFPCSGYCRWWGPVSCDVYDLASPLGRMGVCVSGCVSEWLGRCDFPMTKRRNSRLGHSHKAIGIIHWFTNKAPRTPTLWKAWVKLQRGADQESGKKQRRKEK